MYSSSERSCYRHVALEDFLRPGPSTVSEVFCSSQHCHSELRYTVLTNWGRGWLSCVCRSVSFTFSSVEPQVLDYLRLFYWVNVPYVSLGFQLWTFLTYDLSYLLLSGLVIFVRITVLSVLVESKSNSHFYNRGVDEFVSVAVQRVTEECCTARDFCIGFQIIN